MSAIQPLEALGLAIFRYEGAGPTNLNVRNNNPGNLRASRVTHTMDSSGYCVFGTFSAGWDALQLELEAKASGNNQHGIGPDSTLYQLMSVYAPVEDHNAPLAYAQFVAHWLTLALGRDVTAGTTLGELTRPQPPKGG